MKTLPSYSIFIKSFLMKIFFLEKQDSCSFNELQLQGRQLWKIPIYVHKLNCSKWYESFSCMSKFIWPEIQYFKIYIFWAIQGKWELYFFPFDKLSSLFQRVFPCRTMTRPLLCMTKYDLLSAKFIQSFLWSTWTMQRRPSTIIQAVHSI